jgi:hypothetical protein
MHNEWIKREKFKSMRVVLHKVAPVVKLQKNM